MPNYTMKPGSKEKNTKGNFSEKETKKLSSFKNFKSDMGGYEPTITATTKTFGGQGGAPITDKSGKIKKAGSKLAHGGKVLETKGRTDKRDKTTRQKARVISYSS